MTTSTITNTSSSHGTAYGGATDPMQSAQARRPSGNAPGGRAGEVNRVLNRITAAFKDGTVWKRELQAAAKDIAALSPAARRSLVNNMANMPHAGSSLLDRFLGEVTSPGPLQYGGLDADDRTALMRNLVSGQDSANLERIFHGLRCQQGAGTEDHQREFSRLVAWGGSADQRIAFVARLADNAAKGNREAARAIAQQIGTLETPADITDALSALDRPTLDKVVRQSVEAVVKAYPAGNGTVATSVMYDTALHTRMAAAVARSPKAMHKAAFIAASGQLIDSSIRAEPGRSTLGSIVNAMSTVIGSDTNGVIGTTLEQVGFDAGAGGYYASSGPQALRAYNSGLIETGNARKIRGIIGLLRCGNDLQADACTRFNSSKRAAYVLGGYTGSVTTALDAISSDKGRRLATAAIFTGTAIDTFKEIAQFLPGNAIGTVAKLGAPAAKSAVALVALELNATNVRAARDQSQLTILTALPQTPDGGSPSTESREAFTTGLTLIERLAR